MAKQQAAQKYIFKINTSRLKKAKWNLTLTLPEARCNEEMISLSDSLMLRWIDELNGVTDGEQEVLRIRREIRRVRKEPPSASTRAAIKRLYAKLDEIQFKPDYLHLVIDKDKDLIRACKGFKVNGIKFVRLLGTNGGVKMSTIVFVNEKLAPILRERIDNGRDQSIPQIPAKLEAYRALTCSGSIPVSQPRGILVVPDCETTFREDVIHLTDENGGEPEMKFIRNFEIVLDESDGYGLILPSLAERWSRELKLGYVASALNTRNSWEKGVVFCFDFIDFAEKIGGKYIVQDAWGNDIDIRDVELVLTTSMLKLWKCYNSIEHYMECCDRNHYTFGIAKTSPRELESERQTNYQFLQSYQLTEEQIAELIRPTAESIQDVLSGDYRKALLYLCGTGLSEETVLGSAPPIARAIMAEPQLFNDPYIKSYIHSMIRKRIDDAKIGVLDVHGNYSIVCGDPYALCQSIFGLPVTGLLKAGEIYNKYWADNGRDYVAVFRAPMSCHNNIRKMRVAKKEEMAYWYQYITTCTLVNAWDSLAAALNGMDKDGDLVFLTDNKILVENIRPVPTVFCVQRSGTKKEVSEDDLVQANIASFGSDIGKITNRVTSMFDVQAQYEPGSKEFKELEYRIICGQLFQQNAIDKAKGVISNPMPRKWFDRMANRLPENPTDEEIERHKLNEKIIADKKPYFMRYIYPIVMSDYRKYTNDSNAKCACKYGMDLETMMSKPSDELTQEQQDFIYYYKKRMPVGMNRCVMNRICWSFEEMFKSKPSPAEAEVTECKTILRGDAEYTWRMWDDVSKAQKEYYDAIKQNAKQAKLRMTNISQKEYNETKLIEFKRKAVQAVTDPKKLCAIMVDLCYNTTGGRQFLWSIVGEDLAEMLLERNENRLSFPVKAADGDIEYKGIRFIMHDMEVQDERNCIK